MKKSNRSVIGRRGRGLHFGPPLRAPSRRKGYRLCAEGAGHPKLIFTFRENGKLRGPYVRPAHEAALRAAIENGRAMERLLAEAGRDLVLGWMSRDDAE